MAVLMFAVPKDDQDEDGILNDVDECQLPEDKDDWEDENGWL